MHTDLSPHLHTDDCNQIVNNWRQCRTDHPTLQYLGKCDHYYIQMTKCLKKERIARRDRSIALSNERKAKFNRMLREEREKLQT